MTSAFSFRRPRKLLLFTVLALLATAIAIFSSRLLYREDFSLMGGKTTIFNRTSSAYEQPSAGLTSEELERHRQGDRDFDAVFVTAPANVNPGLGPLFNNTSCTGCHLRDGRGLPENGQLLVRVSEGHSGKGSIGTTPSLSGLGEQIQDFAIFGIPAEAKVEVEWQEREGRYADGTSYRMRSPQAKITLADGKSLPSQVLTSMRIPPPVFGLGLLEAIPERTIRQQADPQDRNRDGISGRPNEVLDVVARSTTLGRFGLKANQPNLLQQTAAAYFNDMGISNVLFPEKDGSTDISRQTLDDATFYVKTLAVPARSSFNDPQVLEGGKLFTQANCNACHLSAVRTGNSPIKALANQTIHPYTDLLLHDMGEGLADRRPDFQATGQEWRTPPLWGIGLSQTVLPYASYLHDGRARTLEEAILWHDGEAKASQETFKNLSQSDRQALIRFLQSL